MDVLPPVELPLFSGSVRHLLTNANARVNNSAFPHSNRIKIANIILDDLWRLMATRNTRQSGSIPTSVPFFFVDLTLSRDDKTAFAAWWEKQSPVMEEVIEMLVRNFGKTTFSYDLSGDCWICATTVTDPRNINYNCCLTSRSDNPLEALALNLYKAFEVLRDADWRSIKSDKSWG